MNGPKRDRRRLKINAAGVASNLLWVPGAVEFYNSTSVRVWPEIIAITEAGFVRTPVQVYDLYAGETPVEPCSGAHAWDGETDLVCESMIIQSDDSLLFYFPEGLPESPILFVIVPLGQGTALRNGMQCGGCSVTLPAPE